MTPELIDLSLKELLIVSDGFEDHVSEWEWKHQYRHMFAVLIRHAEAKEKNVQPVKSKKK